MHNFAHVLILNFAEQVVAQEKEIQTILLQYIIDYPF